MLTFASMVLLSLASVQGAPVPVILDTDLGDDIDDTWALAALLTSPGIDLKLITTAFDNTPKKTRLVGKILQAMGHPNIPLGTGVKTSDKATNQDAWLGDYDLKQYPGKVHEDGVQALIDTIHASPVPVVLCVIGPQTNIKAALERSPDIAKKARVVSMAGSVRIGYDGAATIAPEWNVVADKAAASAVLVAPWDVTYAPLDSCGQLRVKGAAYENLTKSPSAYAKTILANYEAWVNRKQHPADSSSILFDTMAVYLIGNNAACAMETVPLVIDDKGFTQTDKQKGRPVHCAMKLTDPAAFERWLIERITR